MKHSENVPVRNNVICSKLITDSPPNSFKGRVLGVAPVTAPPQWRESVRSGFPLSNVDLSAVQLIAHPFWFVWVAERVLNDWDTGDPEILMAAAFSGQR
jgi:hypothetical protein